MKSHAIRLKPGHDLRQEIEALVERESIQAGAVLTCVGSLSTAVLRMAGQKGLTFFERDFEIVSLVGTLSKDGCHLHLGLADFEGKMTGGHLAKGCLIRTTAEIVIAELRDFRFERDLDAETGYDELVIKKKT
jgi:predicted DNA-binding protein with PD1-like motif